ERTKRQEQERRTARYPWRFNLRAGLSATAYPLLPAAEERWLPDCWRRYLSRWQHIFWLRRGHLVRGRCDPKGCGHRSISNPKRSLSSKQQSRIPDRRDVD